MSELPPMALLDAASRALGSARYAAQPRNFLDRWWAALFPKRTRRIEQQFHVLELLIQQFSATLAHQHQQAEAFHRESTRLAQTQTAMLQGLVARLQASESRTAQLEHAAKHEFASQAALAELAQSHQQAADLLVTLQPLPGQLIAERQRLTTALHTLEQVQGALQPLTPLPAALATLTRDLTASIEALRSVELAHSRKLNQLGRASLQFAELLGQLNDQPFYDERFARFYLAFENRYRGSEAEISQRLAIYLPVLTEIAAPPELPVLDLGCGRGEMLQLLRDAGLKARGVDTNEEMLKRCRSAGHEVVSADAIAYLAKLPDGSCRAITAFHLIEHLPFPKLLELLQEARRVLVPGGALILETPSCHNLLVAATTFHSDPTHNHPLPATLMSFALEHTGFAAIELRFLHPYPEDMKLAETSEENKRFNEYFYGAQDYALIARRPSA
ncbi:MAG: methyltransferase domain-containing protein [Verrucomicrobia bacterium]|nr:methyltransferase domain-containing protein [Verrucomicrobiota bacterium]